MKESLFDVKGAINMGTLQMNVLCIFKGDQEGLKLLLGRKGQLCKGTIPLGIQWGEEETHQLICPQGLIEVNSIADNFSS
jgi:hypothetical protein